jgi:hypothetical protein
MANQEGDGGGGGGNDDKGLFEQDPHVEQLRPEPSAPPADVVILEGLAGKSDREGWGRLYFNRTLTYYAEFRREDIVFTEAIPPEQGPMVGLKATRVGIKKDAVIEYTRTTRATVQDEFDLDVRLGAAAPRQAAQPNIPDSNFDCPITIGIECPTQPFGCVTDQTCGCQTQQRTECFGFTCAGTCRTDCDQATCDTCRTKCGQNTCQTCNQNTCNTCNTCQTQCAQATCQTCNTCQTQCGQATCQTCRTQCGQATCNTCRTQCDQATCDTCQRCPTFNPHVFTCGPRCVEP